MTVAPKLSWRGAWKAQGWKLDRDEILAVDAMLEKHAPGVTEEEKLEAVEEFIETSASPFRPKEKQLRRIILNNRKRGGYGSDVNAIIGVDCQTCKDKGFVHVPFWMVQDGGILSITPPVVVHVGTALPERKAKQYPTASLVSFHLYPCPCGKGQDTLAMWYPEITGGMYNKMKALSVWVGDWLNGLTEDDVDWAYSPYFEQADKAAAIKAGHLIPATRTVEAITRGVQSTMTVETPGGSGGFSREEKRQMSIMRDAERDSINQLVEEAPPDDGEQFPF